MRYLVLVEAREPFRAQEVEKLRKDFLMLMKNLKLVKTSEQAEEFAQLAAAYRRAVEILIKRVIDGLWEAVWARLGVDSAAPWHHDQVERDVKYWQKRLGAETWGLLTNLSPHAPDRASLERHWKGTSQEVTPEFVEAEYKRWADKNAKTWESRLRRGAREAWKVLDDYVSWYEQQGVPSSVDKPEDIQQELEGFQVRLLAADRRKGQPHYEGYLDQFKKGLRIFRERAKTTFPWLLKNMLPIELDLEKCNLDSWAFYEGDHIRYCTSSTHPAREVARVLTHEMGHHVYKTYLSAADREAWSSATRAGTTLDLRDLLPRLRELPDADQDLYSLEKRLRDTDPVLALQLATLSFTDRKDLVLAKPAELEARISAGNPILQVPALPITGYAAKNAEEGFCEALGLAVAYGPRALLPPVRGALAAILPALRLESLRDLLGAVQAVLAEG